ncbi:MAG: hypothetical protein AAF436_07370 [Myxococcota bacterium]
MNTALLVIVMSLVSLVGATIVGGAIGLGVMRLGSWFKRRPRANVLQPRNRESLP